MSVILELHTSALTDSIGGKPGACWICKIMLTAKLQLFLTGVITQPGVHLLPSTPTLSLHGAAVGGARPILVHVLDHHLGKKKAYCVFPDV